MIIPTDEQQAIIDHDHGPALVFAVAGSGKTFTVARRIDRLVYQSVFEASKILATSFNKEAVMQIKRRVSPPHRSVVRIMSLHALGYRVIENAVEHGYIFSGIRIDANTIIAQTVREARNRQDLKNFVEHLDWEDFDAYVGRCKGNLLYADLESADLPFDALKVAGQAVSPANRPWYLEIYRLYERIRASKRWITFDDMLMSGWEMLVKHADVLQEVSTRYQCVIVDEFQDINLAQSEMLHQIANVHRNYMAVGDDDQTIYEWRGASPSYILRFADRYGATKYTISDNFRCPAAQIVLANEVIKHNLQREPKALSVTQGFTGTVLLHGCSSSEDAGARIVDEIKHLLTDGVPVSQIVILVRTYSQTASFEPALLSHNIPYVVVGNMPFYRRREIVILIHYLTSGFVEAKLVKGDTLTAADVKRLRNAWDSIYNTPSRFVSKEAADYIRRHVVTGGIPFSRALIAVSEEPKYHRVADELLSLSGIIEFLGRSMGSPAEEVLRELDSRLRYRQKLSLACAIEEIGRSKAESVTAFMKYSKGKGNVAEFLSHLDELSFSSIDEGEQDPEVSGKLRITSIYRAKGSEWKHVFLPDCNDGTIPLANRDNEEEERRLFYVAITRTQENLHLFWTKPHPTELLRTADYEVLLHDVEVFQTATSTHEDYRKNPDLIHRLAKKLSFKRFVERWWKGDKTTAEHIIKGIETCADSQSTDANQTASLSVTSSEREGHESSGQHVASARGVLLPAIRPGTAALSAKMEVRKTVVATRHSNGVVVGAASPHVTRAEGLLRTGDRVIHPHYGAGVIEEDRGGIDHKYGQLVYVRFADAAREMHAKLAGLKREDAEQ